LNLKDAIKKYFSRYGDEEEDELKKKKKKKKKKLRAGSYFKGARKEYESELERASDY